MSYDNWKACDPEEEEYAKLYERYGTLTDQELVELYMERNKQGLAPGIAEDMINYLIDTHEKFNDE